MSLRLWIPYTNGVKNQGISPYTITNTGTSNNSGKLGNCYSFNQTYTKVQSSPISGLNKFSIACWVYLTSSTYNIFTFENNAFWQFILQNNQLSVRDNVSGSTGSRVDQNITSLPTSTWLHLTVTYNQGNVQIYWNGILKETKTFSGTSLNSHNLLYIGADAENSTSAYPGNCKINDFRVYDHCLSEDEIHELSLGKVGHWCLNDYEISRSGLTSVTWNQLVKNGNFANGYTNWTTPNNATITIDSNKVVTITKTNGSSMGAMFASNVTSVNTSHKYYISAQLADGTVSAAFGFHTSAGSVSSNTVLYSDSTILKKYSAVVQPIRTTDILFVRCGFSATANGSTCKCANIICTDLTAMFGSGNEPTAAQFDKMFPLLYYPYDAGTVRNLKLPIPDISGYHNNLTAYGSEMSLVSNSPRYDKCVSLPTNTYFSLGSSTACKVSPQISVSIWVYKDSWSESSCVPISCTQNGGFNLQAPISTNKLEWLIYNNSAYTKVSSISDLTNFTSGWHHLCGTYDGTTSKFYIDGVLQGSATTTGTFTYHPSNAIFIGAEAGADTTTPTGSYLNGKLSDVRIYATALSTDDVQKLYKLGNI